MKKRIGKCRICGEEGYLTFEHIPPRSAGNKQEARVITNDSFTKLITDKNRLPWDTAGIKTQNLQKGSGCWSLCEKCNNLTGAYYGDEYVAIAKEFTSWFYNHQDEVMNNSMFECKLKIHPLRFIKQVLSMFCSTTDGLTDKFPELKEILLDKEKIINDPNFKVFMYLLRDQTLLYTGENVVFKIFPRTLIHCSEMSLFPFGFVFYFDKESKNDELLDITGFLSYSYDDLSILNLTLPIKSKSVPMPLDFRDKENFLRDRSSYKNGEDNNDK